jgi:Thiamine pyrophosphate enzyme, N-terminal TPP binding domain
MAAVGYAKFTGKLGVCFSTAAPGAVHLLNGLLDARVEQAPLLAITGMSYHELVGTSYLQDINTDYLFNDVALYNQRIMGPQHITNVVDYAVRTSLTHRGPSHLAEDVAEAAAEQGLNTVRLRLRQPEDASPLIAGPFQDWYGRNGRPASRLLVSSFLLMDPLLAIRTGSVPYWALFGTQSSQDRLAGYLSRAHRYDDIRMTVFPHGTDSIGLASIGEWQAVLDYARQRGELVAIDPSCYPRHFRALTGFHRELIRLPRAPALPPLSWEAAQQYLATHAPAFDVAFGEDRGSLTQGGAAQP